MPQFRQMTFSWLLTLMCLLPLTVWAQIGRPVNVPGTQLSTQTPTAGTSINCNTPPTGGTIGLALYVLVSGSGGPVTITASQRITAGLYIGQECWMKGGSDTNTVTLATGNGVSVSHTVVLKLTSDGTKPQNPMKWIWNGTVWYAASYPEPGIQEVLGQGKVAVGLDGVSTSLGLCNTNGTACIRLYCTPTACSIDVIPAQDAVFILGLGKDFIIKSSTDIPRISIDGDTGTITYAAYKTIIRDAGGMELDGTNCQTGSQQTFASGDRVYAFQCTANTGRFEYGMTMPGNYSGGPVRLTLEVYHIGTVSNTMSGNFSAHCGTPNNTWSANVPASITAAVTADYQYSAKVTVTPVGSCAPNRKLHWRYIPTATNVNFWVTSVTMEIPVTGEVP